MLSRAAAVASLLATARTATALEWSQCTDETLAGPLPFDCGSITVPMDYADDSVGSFDLELVRVPAVKEPSLGTIIMNFGGPGAEGRLTLASLGSLFSKLTGEQWDLLSFDPRGTGVTMPFSCYESPAEAIILNVETADYANTSDTTLVRQFYYADVYADTCINSEAAVGLAPYIGTAAVARDMMSIVDALDQGDKLNYWGLSYGTTLGATAVSMFPERMGRVLLDSVQNPHEYYHAPADFEEWLVTDKSWMGLFESCVEHADLCPLATRSSDPVELEAMVWNAIVGLKWKPMPLGGVLLELSSILAIIALAQYRASSFAKLSTILDALLDGPSEELEALVLGLIPSISDASVNSEPLLGIHCGDRDFRSDDWEEMKAVADQLEDISKIIGGGLPAFSFLCAKYPFDVAERYEGDFTAETPEPVLLVVNTLDAHTPPESAYNVSSGFKDSVVLEIDGHGHGIIANPSKCAVQYLDAFWLNGTMPDDGIICDIEAGPFSTVTWDDVFADLEGGNSTLKRSAVSVGDFDYLPQWKF